MSNKIPVSELYRYLQMMLDDHWGYIWGTAGILWTEKRQAATDNEMAQRYGKRWIGHMVTDCSGVLVYIYKQFGLKIPHGSSSMVRQGYITDCGPTPHPGWAALVDDTPDTPDNKHIGVVGPDGYTVYEAKGTQSGFVTSTVKDKKWSKFGRLKDVDYNAKDVIPMPEPICQAQVTTSGGTLRLRSGPNTNTKKLTDIPNGAILDIFSDEDGWSKTTYNGLIGYCCDKYLTMLVKPSKEDPEPSEGVWAVIIPCGNKQEAEWLGQLFTNAIVAQEGTE